MDFKDIKNLIESIEASNSQVSGDDSITESLLVLDEKVSDFLDDNWDLFYEVITTQHQDIVNDLIVAGISNRKNDEITINTLIKVATNLYAAKRREDEEARF